MPNTLPMLSSSLAVLLSAGKVCARIAKEMDFSSPSHLKCGGLCRAGGLRCISKLLASKRGWQAHQNLLSLPR